MEEFEKKPSLLESFMQSTSSSSSMSSKAVRVESEVKKSSLLDTIEQMEDEAFFEETDLTLPSNVRMEKEGLKVDTTDGRNVETASPQRSTAAATCSATSPSRRWSPSRTASRCFPSETPSRNTIGCVGFPVSPMRPRREVLLEGAVARQERQDARRGAERRDGFPGFPV